MCLYGTGEELAVICTPVCSAALYTLILRSCTTSELHCKRKTTTNNKTINTTVCLKKKPTQEMLQSPQTAPFLSPVLPSCLLPWGQEPRSECVCSRVCWLLRGGSSYKWGPPSRCWLPYGFQTGEWAEERASSLLAQSFCLFQAVGKAPSFVPVQSKGL